MSVHWFESKTSERNSKSATQLKKEKNYEIHAVAQKKTTDKVRTQPDTSLIRVVVSVQMKWPC